MADVVHTLWMQAAIEEARKGLGLTRPNPSVGAVLVKSKTVVGSGWHRKAGGPHAEVEAIRDAGDAVKGATLYVTLEPCSTQGRTPACTEAILNAGIRRVVVGCLDPNPKHAGAGITRLTEAGVAVTTGILEEDCKDLIKGFESTMLKKRPRVLLKMGVTLDGRIADTKGDSKWITGPEARKQVQVLRRASDAIVVGRGTVAKDNPSLIPKPAKGRKPYRVVLDSTLSTSPKATVYTDAFADRTLVFCGKEYTSSKRKMLEKQGVRIHVAKTKRPSWAFVLKTLFQEYGCLQILCEGGGKIADSLIRSQLLDEVHWMMAPSVLGAGSASVEGGGYSLKNMPEFDFTDVQQLGRDVWMTAQPKKVK